MKIRVVIFTQPTKTKVIVFIHQIKFKQCNFSNIEKKNNEKQRRKRKTTKKKKNNKEKLKEKQRITEIKKYEGIAVKTNNSDESDPNRMLHIRLNALIT